MNEFDELEEHELEEQPRRQRITDDELNNLIGTTLEVFNDINVDNSGTKEITVKKWKRVGESFILIAEDGEIYSEEEVNWHYSITPEAALWVSLMDAGIIPDDFAGFDFDKYHKAFHAFMDKLVSLQILATANNDEDEALCENLSEDIADDKCDDDSVTENPE